MRSAISRAGDDVRHPPAVRVADVHVLDEAEDVARSAEALRHLDDAAVVLAAFDDDVDLDRTESGVRGRVDRVEDAGNGELDVVHAPEDGVVERVEADRDAIQSGLAQCDRFLARQQRAVRRECNILHTARGGEHRHEALQIAAKQRLAAGQSDLLNAFVGKELREAGDLLERQQLGAVEEGEVAAEDLFRHAVGAAKVTAVCNRYPQVAKGTAERVNCHSAQTTPAAGTKTPARPARVWPRRARCDRRGGLRSN